MSVRALLLAAAASVAFAAPASAQDHDAMDHSAMGHGEAETAPVDHSQMDHSTMDHGTPVDYSQMDHSAMGHSAPADHSQMDHSAMDHGAPADHSQMEHSAMGRDAPADHSQMDHSAMGHGARMPDAAPPARAFEGPRHAADAYWGEAAMAPARDRLARENGEFTTATMMLERLEARVRNGEDLYLWDAQGWLGGDIDKLFLKSEGEGEFGGRVESAEIQALWSHAIGPFFDLQAGARYDIEPRSRGYAVLGVQGLAPYMFEVDAALFLSDKGDLTARIEGEYDQHLTQRLILQPRAELELAAQDVPELGLGSGLTKLETGMRLRYEIAREFAPYIGVGYEAALGQTADRVRAAGGDPDGFAFLFGVRAWF